MGLVVLVVWEGLSDPAGLAVALEWKVELLALQGWLWCWWSSICHNYLSNRLHLPSIYIMKYLLLFVFSSLTLALFLITDTCLKYTEPRTLILIKIVIYLVGWFVNSFQELLLIPILIIVLWNLLPL